jgi:alkylation response protein AidB-like acyl-CoA dehydrogenase
VTLSGVVAETSAVVHEGAAAIGASEFQLQVGVVLLCAETIGALDALFSMTVAYAKDRVAFGWPIGSFQSIKHILADQVLFLETAKAAAVDAAHAVAECRPDAASAVSIAKAYIGDIGIDLVQECLQVHGGIGYTWEHDLHLYLRRVTANAALLGTSSWHRERLCRLGGLDADVTSSPSEREETTV